MLVYSRNFSDNRTEYGTTVKHAHQHDFTTVLLQQIITMKNWTGSQPQQVHCMFCCTGCRSQQGVKMPPAARAGWGQITKLSRVIYRCLYDFSSLLVFDFIVNKKILCTTWKCIYLFFFFLSVNLVVAKSNTLENWCYGTFGSFTWKMYNFCMCSFVKTQE